jgi:hypothetical protein
MKPTLFLSALVTVCSISFAQDKTVSKSFSGIKSIKLNTSSGDIDLKKSNGKDVKVTVKYSYDDEDYKLVMEATSSQLTLKEKFSQDSHSGNSKWILEIPDDLSLNVNTGSGNISLNDLSINIKSNSGSGDILITSVKGDIDFNTGSGNAELSDANGKIHVNTGSGDISALKGSGNYSFNAGSGNIRLNDLKGDFGINTGSGDIAAKSISISDASSFNTGSGDATVTLTGSLDHDISVNSGSGDSKLNFNGSTISGEVIMTANKKGGDIVAPFPFDKEETIQDDNSSARIRKTAKLGTKNIQIKVGTGSGTAEITR